MVRGLDVMRGRYADEVILWRVYGRVEEAMLSVGVGVGLRLGEYLLLLLCW